MVQILCSLLVTNNANLQRAIAIPQRGRWQSLAGCAAAGLLGGAKHLGEGQGDRSLHASAYGAMVN